MARQRLTVKTSKPLTAEHLALLNKVLQSCAETDTYCDQCLSCGIDVSPEKRTNLEQQRTAERLKRTFFPDAP